MQYANQLWIIVPVCVVMVWQCCNLRLGAHALEEHNNFPSSSIMKYEWRNSSSLDIDPLLGLHMIIVALRSGVSIPRALDVVGSVLPGGYGIWLCNVSNALLLGDSWHEAWSETYVHNLKPEQNKKSSKYAKNDEIDSSTILANWLSMALYESWCRGSSPVPVLSALSEHYEQTMANVARQETSRLSVRLLLPVGLCFLPAFMCIGIFPTVASFMH